MSDNDLDVFKAGTPSAPVLEEKDYLTELVGEGKPYKDQASLAKAVVFKEEHIKRLEQEMQIAREEIAKRATVEDMMDQIKSAQKAPEAPGIVPQTPAPTPLKDPREPVDVEKVVAQQLSNMRDQERRAANAKHVKQELEKRFGGSYETVLRGRVSQLGLSEEDVNSLAQTKPEAFLAMLGTPQPKPSDPSVPSSSRIPPQTSTGKGWQYYEDLRRKDPVTYLSQKNLLEMDRELTRQGASFYDH